MEKKSRLRLALGLVILMPLLAVLVALRTGGLVFQVISPSMEPTILVGDRILVSPGKSPELHDIVTLPDPKGGEDALPLVKRVMAEGGDIVRIDDGLLYVNGEAQFSSDVTSDRINWPDVRVKVPHGKLFLLGDNRNDSYDSLDFGPVDADSVTGVLTYILWPPSRFGKIPPFRAE